MRTHEEVSLTTSESETEVSRLALANERSATKIFYKKSSLSYCPVIQENHPFMGGFLMARKVDENSRGSEFDYEREANESAPMIIFIVNVHLK